MPQKLFHAANASSHTPQDVITSAVCAVGQHDLGNLTYCAFEIGLPMRIATLQPNHEKRDDHVEGIEINDNVVSEDRSHRLERSHAPQARRRRQADPLGDLTRRRPR